MTLKTRILVSSERVMHKSFSDSIVASLNNKEMLIPMSETEYDETFCNDSNDIVLGAFIDGRLIATSSLLFNISDYRMSTETRLMIASSICAEIGECMTLPEFRGQGIMPLLNSQLIAIARNKGVEHLLATAHPENKASCNSLKKVGFQYLATFLRHGLIRNIYAMKT